MGYIDVWEHSRGGRHIDADWSPIFEDLNSSELGNSLGCRGSACVEVMTTLHGSAPSFWRRAEGCVSPEIQDETPYDSLPPPPPPLGLTVPWAPPYLLHGHFEVASPAVVQTTVLGDTHACMDRIEQRIRQLRVSDISAAWDDLEGH
ncbi:hypothetical protein CK203_051576 [Vitis vinifera]|uniref:Uncharacterized protein n=1 Tax=Vitis vinifera TaxID=29760 RepID=A0A438GXH1_VITVI|nr:hypothetical protein CK203_051576 [Vitis vinifera]